ncbi:hypothetical protein ZIOFF_028460 [Zingiber officinale]|uniref:Uncharacterized protein n=1 Tax=Zingiber officinale TaxID=94328 RepID=A0A8J5GZP5_ZINOF|nr:hypothetical protein ZIOFF_028460 [Zingiber officinale]
MMADAIGGGARGTRHQSETHGAASVGDERHRAKTHREASGDDGIGQMLGHNDEKEMGREDARLRIGKDWNRASSAVFRGWPSSMFGGIRRQNRRGQRCGHCKHRAPAGIVASLDALLKEFVSASNEEQNAILSRMEEEVAKLTGSSAR